MKKFISILLALTLVLSLGVVAFAEGQTPTEPETTTVTPSTAISFNFEKKYETTAGVTPATYPAEVLAFTVTKADGNPDDTMVTIDDKTVDGNPDDIVVNVPSYDKVGKWNYTVAEQPGSTQGVSYSNVSFGVQVMVAYNADGTALVASTTFTTSDGNEGKIDEIVNTYDLGSLTVSKTIDGSLGDKNSTQSFNMTVTFTSNKVVKSAITVGDGTTIAVADWTGPENGLWTATKTISVQNKGDLTISNIPAGVTYTVVESDEYQTPDASGNDDAKGYEAPKYKVNNGAEASAASDSIAANDADTVEVINVKCGSVDTGISMDSIPYVLLIAVSVVGLAVFFSRKRVID